MGIEHGFQQGPLGSSVVRRLPLQAPERTPAPRLARGPRAGADVRGGLALVQHGPEEAAEPIPQRHPGRLGRLTGGLLALTRWVAVAGLLLVASASAFWASYRYLAPALGITAAAPAMPAGADIQHQFEHAAGQLALGRRTAAPARPGTGRAAVSAHASSQPSAPALAVDR